jgi:hypothetical protein
VLLGAQDFRIVGVSIIATDISETLARIANVDAQHHQSHYCSAYLQ